MGQRRRATWMVIASLVIVLMAVGTFAVSRFVRSPADQVASAEPPAPTLLTATVKREALAAPAVLRGRVVWRGTRSVVPVLDPARISVVTATPVSPGEEVRPGGVLVEISDRPLLVLAGHIPMLRDLHLGDRGADVTRLQDGLADAGYRSVDSSGVFGTSTAAALARLYADRDYDPPRESDDAGRIYAAKGELEFIPDLPVPVVSLTHGRGDSVDQAVAVVGVGGPVVTLTVPGPSDLPKGTAVEVTPAKKGARSWSGVVEKVGPRRISEEGGAVVDVTVALEGSVSGSLVGRAVEVAPAERPRVGLIVPLSAVHSKADGSLFLRVVRGGSESPIAVALIETGSGSARIKPAVPHALREGDEVALGMVR